MKYSDLITEKISKRDDKWEVTDSTGKKYQVHPTREEALKQLRVVEWSKHSGK